MASGKKPVPRHIRRERRVAKAYRERQQKRRFYESQAKRLSRFVPSLKPLAKKRKFTPAEKGRISHYSKVLRHARNLRPVTKAQAKKFKKQLYAPGVQAIELDGTTPDAKIKVLGDDILVSQNGRTWVYWHLDRATVKSKSKMKSAGQRAFDMAFPIEKLADLAAKAFKQFNVVQVHLWAHSGRVGQPFDTLPEFLRWIDEKWQAGRYVAIDPNGRTNASDPEKWVNGLAILVEENGKKYKPENKSATPKPKPRKDEMG